MKKVFTLLLASLLAFSMTAQETKSSDDSFQTTRAGFGEASGFNMGPGFVNPRVRTEGSAYYFDTWDTEAGSFVLDLENDVLPGCVITHNGAVINQTIKNILEGGS